MFNKRNIIYSNGIRTYVLWFHICNFVFHTLRKLLRFVTSALYSMHQAQCPFTQPKICVNLYTLVSSSKCRASIQCTSAQCPFHKSAKPNNLKVTVHQTVCIFSKKSSIAFRNTLSILDTCQRWISLVLYFSLPKMFVNLYKLASSSKCRTQNVWKS